MIHTDGTPTIANGAGDDYDPDLPYDAKTQRIKRSREAAKRQPDITTEILRYENGDLGEDETLAMFQNLVDSGLAWRLQGSYGRMAAMLIEAGLLKFP